MLRLTRWFEVTSIVTVVAWCGAAAAQMPVCPQPDPQQPMITGCASGGRYAAATFLSDLAIDHTVRGEGAAIVREPGGLFRSIANEEMREKHASLDEYLGRLSPLLLHRFDAASGTLKMDVAEGERSFSTAIEIGETSHRFAIELPERVEGGYWRTPGVLQAAFWSGRRATIRTALADGSELAAEIECLVVSGDGVRLVTSGSSVPDVLVRFDLCQ